MKKVIITVGTSLFEKFLKRNSAIQNQYALLKEKPYSEINDYRTEIENIKESVSSFAKDYNSSAEMKTLSELKRKENEEIEIYFFCTDTILSYLSAIIHEENFKIGFVNKQVKVIEGLQIGNYEQYDSLGFSNLISSFKIIHNEAKQENSELLLAVSGGYKAILPPLTILGQIYDVQLVYIYEDSNELIYFPSLPVHFDWSLSEEFYPYLKEISGGKKINSDLSTDEMLEMHLLRKSNSGFKITPLGKIFKEYIETEMPLADNTLGFFVEYKLLEHLMENPYENRFKKIAHSKRIKHGNEEREIDLILEDESNGQIITLESKSFLQIYRNNDFVKLLEQINAQIKILKKGNYNIYEYHLSIHHTNYLEDNQIMSNLKKVKTMIEDALDKKVKFKAFSLRINLSLKNRNYFRNPYQKFLSLPIELKEIKIN